MTRFFHFSPRAALFAVGNFTSSFSRAQLLAAAPASHSFDRRVVQGTAGNVTFRPFASIDDEVYLLHENVEA
jgi:hypothetical protein